MCVLHDMMLPHLHLRRCGLITGSRMSVRVNVHWLLCQQLSDSLSALIHVSSICRSINSPRMYVQVPLSQSSKLR